MDQSSTFARHFSRLVWLMMNESGSVDEQKMSLRALVQVSKSGAVSLSVRDGELFAGDDPVAGVLTGVHDLVGQMSAHSVMAVEIDEGCGPADILGLARLFAAAAVANDGGANVSEKLGALSAPGIRIHTAPVSSERLAEAPTTPMAPLPEDESAPPEEPPQSEEAPPAPEAAASPAPVETPAAPEAPKPPAPSPRSTPASGARKMSEASAALLAQLSGRTVTTLPPEELLAILDKTASAGEAEPSVKILDDLVSLAEFSARTGKPATVLEVLHGVVKRQDVLKEGDVKSAFVLAMRRLTKPALLRAVAGLITKQPEARQAVYEVVAAAGEDGADALIEQVGQARSTEERQTFVETLVELKDAVPALVRMLGDSRWFVVRNAADLLGEMVATKAEGALVNLLRHTDDRVRRSATNALLKLGTPDAVKGVYEAVNDESPEVRMQAAAAMSTRKDSKTSATLIRAIEGENDGDVQLAMIAALGKVATPDAVQKLMKLAEAEGRLFRKKDSSLRVAAVVALGEARSPAAVNALKNLADDKDKDVRETATRALAQIGR